MPGTVVRPEWYSICYLGDRNGMLKTQKKEKRLGRAGNNSQRKGYLNWILKDV